MIVSRNAKIFEVEVIKGKSFIVYTLKANCKKCAKDEIMKIHKVESKQVKSVIEVK